MVILSWGPTAIHSQWRTKSDQLHEWLVEQREQQRMEHAWNKEGRKEGWKQELDTRIQHI